MSANVAWHRVICDERERERNRRKRNQRDNYTHAAITEIRESYGTYGAYLTCCRQSHRLLARGDCGEEKTYARASRVVCVFLARAASSRKGGRTSTLSIGSAQRPVSERARVLTTVRVRGEYKRRAVKPELCPRKFFTPEQRECSSRAVSSLCARVCVSLAPSPSWCVSRR